MNGNKHVSIDVLADRTGLPIAWLKRQADSGHLPCLLVGRRRMFNEAAVGAALAQMAGPPSRHSGARSVPTEPTPNNPGKKALAQSLGKSDRSAPEFHDGTGVNPASCDSPRPTTPRPESRSGDSAADGSPA